MTVPPRRPTPLPAPAAADSIDRSAEPGWTLPAPAKLNLFLEVRHRREDGFHELETVMAPVRVADRVTLWRTDRGPETELRVVGPFAKTPDGTPIPTDDHNLVCRALEKLRQMAGVDQGARVLLEKRVPSEAGMGGGSSDATAAILLANHAWELGLPDRDLHEVAASVGSDVPFFLQTGTAVCRGRGEQVEPLTMRSSHPCVIVKPTIGLSTKAVFDALAEDRGPGPMRTLSDMVAAAAGGDWRAIARQQFNRLENAAMRLAGGLRDAAARLATAGGLEWMLTGSGSAMFALAPSDRAARTAAQRLRQRGFDWAVATRLG